MKLAFSLLLFTLAPACHRMRPIDVLKHAELCYQFRYPLAQAAQIKDSPRARLILTGAAEVAPGKWRDAVILEDGQAILARWQYVGPAPAAAAGLRVDFKPYRDSLLLAHGDVHGMLGYDSIGASGILYQAKRGPRLSEDEGDTWSWGVGGTRIICPTTLE